MKSKPQLLAWLTCDAVHIDPATGKHTLLGTFSNIRVRQFPAVHPRMVWFLCISDVPVGVHELKIAFAAPLEEPRIIIRREFESKSPVHRINLINEIQNLPFQQEGDHSIIVEIDDEILLVTTLGVGA